MTDNCNVCVHVVQFGSVIFLKREKKKVNEAFCKRQQTGVQCHGVWLGAMGRCVRAGLSV